MAQSDGSSQTLPQKPTGKVVSEPEFSWTHAVAAVVLCVLLLMLAFVVAGQAGLVFDRMSGLDEPRAYAPGQQAALTTARLALFLVIFQLATIALCVAVAALFSSISRRTVPMARLLPLAAPRGGAWGVAADACALLVLASAFGAAVATFDPEAVSRDVSPFVALMRSQTWGLLAFAAIVGAPLAEEALFRGVVYEVVRDSPAGWRAAAFVSAISWAAMHANYSAYGLSAIFLIGLYLAWVREKSGSLIAPVVCHATYNAAVVAVTMAMPDSAFPA